MIKNMLKDLVDSIEAERIRVNERLKEEGYDEVTAEIAAWKEKYPNEVALMSHVTQDIYGDFKDTLLKLVEFTAQARPALGLAFLKLITISTTSCMKDMVRSVEDVVKEEQQEANNESKKEA